MLFKQGHRIGIECFDFAVVGRRLLISLCRMTKLAEIQEAIIGLSPVEQDALRIWLDEAPLDLEQDSPELEAELLKAVRGPHTPLKKGDLEAIAERVWREQSRRPA